jgi:hypothetical protein
MAFRQGNNWGLKAAACAAIVVWQIYEIVNVSVFAPDDGKQLHYLIVAVGLVGLIASLVKLSVDY